MLNESVVKLLKESVWDLATCADGEPNVVPVAFKDVTEDGKLLVGDVFLETTLNNIKANDGKITISVYDAQNLEGYQIKGTAQYVTEAQPVKDLLVKQVSSSVKWQQCVETMLADGVDTFIEIGPGKTLAGFMKKIDRSVKTLNVEKLEDIEKVVEALKEA